MGALALQRRIKGRRQRTAENLMAGKLCQMHAGEGGLIHILKRGELRVMVIDREHIGHPAIAPQHQHPPRQQMRRLLGNAHAPLGRTDESKLPQFQKQQLRLARHSGGAQGVQVSRIGAPRPSSKANMPSAMAGLPRAAISISGLRRRRACSLITASSGRPVRSALLQASSSSKA